MILTKEIEIKVNNISLEHYREVFGENIKIGDTVVVSPENLPKYSGAKILVKCDYCGKEFTREYSILLKGRKHIQKDACIKCRSEKYKETNLLLYGVENVMQVPKVKERLKNSIREKYGVDNVMKREDFLEMRNQTNLEKYGAISPLLNPEVRKKTEATNEEKYGAKTFMGSEKGQEIVTKTMMERYGVKKPFQNKEIKEKAEQTLLDKYGIKSPLLDKEVRRKTEDTIKEKYGGWENMRTRFLGDGQIPSSKQQRLLQEYYGCEINTQIGNFFVDLYFPNEKIIIEYDGSGHDLSVKYGNLTQEQFDKREENRVNYLLELGYKIARIVNPTEKKIGETLAIKIKEQIFEKLKTKDYFIYTV